MLLHESWQVQPPSESLSHTLPPKNPVKSASAPKRILHLRAGRILASMRFVAQPQINTQPFAAVAASIGGWLSALLIWIFEVYESLPPQVRQAPLIRAALQWAKARVAADLRRTARCVRLLIVAHAFARMRLTARPPRLGHPPSTACGVRRARRAHYSVRRFVGGTLSGLHHGSLRERAETLQRALANLPALIERVLKRMYAMWRTRGEPALILVAALDVCRSIARARAPALVDTS